MGALYLSKIVWIVWSTWNVGETNKISKREEVVDIFGKGKFELLGLTEIKMKENGRYGVE